MKGQYVRSMAVGSRVDSLFALSSRDIRSARTGDPYLSLEIADCSGRIPAVMFRPSADLEALPVGSIVRVRGAATTYRGVRRVVVDAMGPAPDHDPCDFLPAGTRDRDEMLAELRATIGGLRDGRLRAVVRAVFGAKGFAERFAACPATTGEHHAYVGGLLEHTLAVATACLGLRLAYPQVDGDLLLAAALLHDVGVTEAISASTSFGETEEGRLIGHAVLGERIVSRAMDEVARTLPSERATRLLHAVLVHDDRPGASSGPPCTLEALLLRQADALDAQASAFLGAVAGAAVLEQSWSDRDNMFGRALAVPSPVLSPDEQRSCA